MVEKQQIHPGNSQVCELCIYSEYSLLTFTEYIHVAGRYTPMTLPGFRSWGWCWVMELSVKPVSYVLRFSAFLPRFTQCLVLIHSMTAFKVCSRVTSTCSPLFELLCFHSLQASEKLWYRGLQTATALSTKLWTQMCYNSAFSGFHSLFVTQQQHLIWVRVYEAPQ